MTEGVKHDESVMDGGGDGWGEKGREFGRRPKEDIPVGLFSSLVEFR